MVIGNISGEVLRYRNQYKKKVVSLYVKGFSEYEKDFAMKILSDLHEQVNDMSYIRFFKLKNYKIDDIKKHYSELLDDCFNYLINDISDESIIDIYNKIFDLVFTFSDFYNEYAESNNKLIMNDFIPLHNFKKITDVEDKDIRRVAILGARGTGKTMLLKSLVGFKDDEILDTSSLRCGNFKTKVISIKGYDNLRVSISLKSEYVIKNKIEPVIISMINWYLKLDDMQMVDDEFLKEAFCKKILRGIDSNFLIGSFLNAGDIDDSFVELFKFTATRIKEIFFSKVLDDRVLKKYTYKQLIKTDSKYEGEFLLFLNDERVLIDKKLEGLHDKFYKENEGLWTDELNENRNVHMNIFNGAKKINIEFLVYYVKESIRNRVRLVINKALMIFHKLEIHGAVDITTTKQNIRWNRKYVSDTNKYISKMVDGDIKEFKTSFLEFFRVINLDIERGINKNSTQLDLFKQFISVFSYGKFGSNIAPFISEIRILGDFTGEFICKDYNKRGIIFEEYDVFLEDEKSVSNDVQSDIFRADKILYTYNVMDGQHRIVAKSLVSLVNLGAGRKINMVMTGYDNLVLKVGADYIDSFMENYMINVMEVVRNCKDKQGESIYLNIDAEAKARDFLKHISLYVSYNKENGEFLRKFDELYERFFKVEIYNKEIAKDIEKLKLSIGVNELSIMLYKEQTKFVEELCESLKSASGEEVKSLVMRFLYNFSYREYKDIKIEADINSSIKYSVKRFLESKLENSVDVEKKNNLSAYIDSIVDEISLGLSIVTEKYIYKDLKDSLWEKVYNLSGEDSYEYRRHMIITEFEKLFKLSGNLDRKISFYKIVMELLKSSERFNDLKVKFDYMG